MKKLKIFIITSAIIFVISITIFITNSSYKEKLSSNNNPPKTSKSYNNALAIMLETGSNTNQYEESTTTSWNTNKYEFNKEKSGCENGGELSWDEENNKIIFISDKPDKCYAYFDKYLEFYLNDVLFEAKPNMTWGEWLASSYSDNWSYKSKILTVEEVENKGCFYGDNRCKNYFVTLTGSIATETVMLFTIATPSLGAGNTNSIYFIRNEKIKDSFSNLYNFLMSSQSSQNISQEELNDNKYWAGLWYQSCLTPDTLIDVEEIDEKGKKRRRRKKLKDIKVGDKVICINPITLELDTDTVIECDGTMNKKHTCYDNWYFSDGTIITTIHRHRFYNVENNKFMYMDEWNINEHGLNINNEKIELIKHEHIEEEINHCTLFTEKYNNYFANGLLSGNRRSKNIKY